MGTLCAARFVGASGDGLLYRAVVTDSYSVASVQDALRDRSLFESNVRIVVRFLDFGLFLFLFSIYLCPGRKSIMFNINETSLYKRTPDKRETSNISEVLTVPTIDHSSNTSEIDWRNKKFKKSLRFDQLILRFFSNDSI